jgi:hypothetical protein
MIFGHNYKGIRAGDYVTYAHRSGTNLDGSPVIRTRTAKVNPMLIFERHVVVNCSLFGEVVNDSNYIKHSSRRSK